MAEETGGTGLGHRAISMERVEKGVFEVTNATNQNNECCARLSATDDGSFLESDTGHWLPTIVNLGVTYRWRGPH